MSPARRALALLLPGGLVVLTGLVLLRPGVVPGSVEAHIGAFAILVLVAGVFLGWYYNQSHIVFALLVLGVADLALRWAGIYATPGGDIGHTVVATLAVLLPLNLVAYSLLAERGPLASRYLKRLLPLLAQIIAVGLMVRPGRPSFMVWLDLRLVDVDWTGWTVIPQSGLAAFGAATLFLIVRCALYRRPIDAGFVWALVSAFVALHGISRGWVPTPFFAAGGWVLIGSLFETRHRQAFYDELTQLPGWRALNEATRQQGSRYVVAMVRVDHFPHLRHTFGREVGDQVLRMVATQLRRVSGGGVAFRYGGEKFTVLFADMPAAETVPHLDAVRRAIASYCFVLRGPGRPRNKPTVLTPPTGPRVAVTVTVSVGVAERDNPASRSRRVIRTAHYALRHAIETGRNQVSIWSPDGTATIAPLHADRESRTEAEAWPESGRDVPRPAAAPLDV